MPSAAASDAFQFDNKIWRAVEAQHRVSTMRLVDNDLGAQTILENLIETAKPVLPQQAQALHWLLAAPFRYRPPVHGSRFRGQFDPGVFYGALLQRTACAECGYWRWRFVKDSAGLTGLDAFPMTLFNARVAATALDLRKLPYVRERLKWTDPTDYTSTQACARKARVSGTGVIVYESVRDPEHGACVAVLAPSAFAQGWNPRSETWYLTVTKERTIWQRGHDASFNFRWTG